jgi:hypothetical protein
MRVEDSESRASHVWLEGRERGERRERERERERENLEIKRRVGESMKGIEIEKKGILH